MTKPAAKANEKKPAGASSADADELASVEGMLPDLEVAIEVLRDRFDVLEFDRLGPLLADEPGTAKARAVTIEATGRDGAAPAASARIEAAADAMVAICDRMDSIVDRLSL